MATIAEDPELIAQFRKLALKPNPSSPEELAKTLRSDNDQYAALIKKLNMKAE